MSNRRFLRREQANLVIRFASRLEETIGFLLWDTTRAYQRVAAPVLARHGIRPGHYMFLRILYEHDGLTLRELSDAAHMRGPTIVEAIREMERQGLVRRQKDRADARKANLFLTNKGRRTHDALVPRSGAINRIGVAGLTKRDQENLKRLLRHLRQNMNEYTGSADDG